MRTERFTKEEKLKAIHDFYKSEDFRDGGERKLLEAIEQRILLVAPSSATYDDCMYAEFYTVTKSLIGDNNDAVFLFYSSGDDVVFNIIAQTNDMNWMNGQLSVLQGYVNLLNESIYGYYDKKHLRGLTLSCFIPHHNVPVYKDSHYSIYAYTGGFGLERSTTTDNGHIISVCFGFVPYDYFKAEYISTVYRKIWHYLLKIIHTNLSGGFTDEADTVKMNLLCTECVNDKDVVQFVKEAFIINGNEEDGFELEINKDFFYNPELEEENEE